MRTETLFLIGLGVMAVPFLLLLVFASGPAGWLLVALALAAAGFVKLSDGAPSVADKNAVGCPNCGARNEATATACRRCGAALERSD